MKKILAVFNIILILIFFIGTTAVYADITEEDISIVKNPDRGLYKLVQVELQNEEENFDDFEKKVDEINENDKEVSLILLELNLKNHVQENNISKNKITEINKYFSIIRKNGYKVIFRVVYDSVGQTNPEPEFNIILQHMDDLKEIYTTNKDIIFVVEAGFLGTNGEWINGKYDKYMTEKNKIIEKLLEIVPEEIQISFRKPTYITDYLSSKNTVTESNAFSTDIISRFGLYNSGYLESENDSDTYNKLERTESIEWQKLQTKYTSFGGEVKNWKSNYNDLENAIKDMFTRHCTYLNKNADENVMEKWKGTLYTGTEEIYNRKSGYVYIQNHFAGIIAETEEGYSFSYDKDYLEREDAAAVSLTLPLREEPYETTILFPFFDGLIPEGWLLGIVSRNWKINQKDRFGLLLLACKDCIGDVYIRGEKI